MREKIQAWAAGAANDVVETCMNAASCSGGAFRRGEEGGSTGVLLSYLGK